MDSSGGYLVVWFSDTAEKDKSDIQILAYVWRGRHITRMLKKM